MEYLHRRKEAPMQGLSGLWGGVGSNLNQAPAGGDNPVLPYEGTTGLTLPMTGGSNWFSSGHYGYEDESTYQFPAGKNLKQIYYRRLQNAAYQWWFIAWERINNNNFTIRYGSKIAVPEGSGNAQEADSLSGMDQYLRAQTLNLVSILLSQSIEFDQPLYQI